MGLLGKSKEDTSQDAQLKEIWKWIKALNENQAILIKNNDVFVENEKAQRQYNKQLTKTVNSLVAKDMEHDALIKGIRDMAAAVETARTETEG